MGKYQINNELISLYHITVQIDASHNKPCIYGSIMYHHFHFFVSNQDHYQTLLACYLQFHNDLKFKKVSMLVCIAYHTALDHVYLW
jgi:hypothetical protein